MARRIRWTSLLPLLALVAVTSSLVSVAPALAQSDDDRAQPPRFAVTPADRPDSWFDLELEPGETANLPVEFANHGDESAAARIYVADVYTLINGGMGVALRDEPESGTGIWLDLASGEVALDPDAAVRRSVTVTVPAETPPGQYLAAVVIEADHAGQSQGDVALERVVRQAIAVNITVPGPAIPALEIGDAELLTAGGQAVVRLGLDNPGNRHLRPQGTLTLTDATGREISNRRLAMDSFYAGSTARVEFPLPDALPAGRYTITADLEDAEHAVHATGSAAFDVESASASGTTIPQRIEHAFDSAPPWLLSAILSGVLLLVLALIFVLVKRRRPTAVRPPVSPLMGTPRDPGSPLHSTLVPAAPSRDRTSPTALHDAEVKVARSTPVTNRAPDPGHASSSATAVADEPMLFTARPGRRSRAR